MSRAADAMPISPGQREALEVLARSGTAPFREVRRVQALLMAADGLPNVQIAAAVGVTAGTVRAWRTRFAEEGLAKCAQVREGRGRKPSIPAETVDEIVRVTLHETPPGAPHWSTRTMAARVGVSRDTVHRVWRARGLQPHRVETFKLSNDPRFEEKLVDVVGLYLNPPDKAVVLCLDEKPGTDVGPHPAVAADEEGPGRHHDPRLQAARHDDSVRRPRRADRGVIGQCLPRHRHDEFLVFLRRIQREVPRGLQVHLILDNYATHSHPDVQAWLAKHPRFHLHFTPTSSSWLNLVERWFRNLTDKRLRRGSFNSVADLIAAIEEYLTIHNEDPKPFVWTATADSILAKVRRGRVALQKVVSQ